MTQEQTDDMAGTTARHRTAPLVASLGLLTAVGPLSIDMYLPAFPAMRSTLETTSSQVQLTMTVFLAGLVLGQLLIGPISDGVGRRRLLIGGTIAYTLSSIACALAPGIEFLIIFRLLQGSCGAVGIVLARAVLTDRFVGPELPRIFAVFSQILGVAPVIAPVLGGLVLSVGDWRTVFVALAGIGLLQFVLVLVNVPESLPPERRNAHGLGPAFRSMGRLLGNRSFVGYMLVLGFTGAALFAFIAGSSFVFQRIHGLSETQYAFVFAGNALGLVVAGQIFGRVSRRIRINRLLIMGVGIALTGNALHVALLLIIGENLAVTWACLFFATIGVGMIFPATMTIGQTIGRATPGAASALMGTLQFLCGAAAAPLVGMVGDDRTLPMALIMVTGFIGVALALVLFARPWLGHGEVVRTGSSSTIRG